MPRPIQAAIGSPEDQNEEPLGKRFPAVQHPTRSLWENVFLATPGSRSSRAVWQRRCQKSSGEGQPVAGLRLRSGPSGVVLNMKGRTACTFRQVATNLWVSDRDHAIQNADNVAVIVDCLGDTHYGGTRAKILRARPTGSTKHRWTVEDLDKITRIVGTIWPAHPVMIHCKRGVSRSACAAAAVLLAAGLVETIEGAMAVVEGPGEEGSRHSMRGVKEGGAARQAAAQQALDM